MGIGDMLQAQRDAEDAARYRWLKAQFTRQVERHQWDELVSETGNRKVYETREEYGITYELKDSWRFGTYGATAEADAPNFDRLVDQLMKEQPALTVDAPHP